MCAQNIKHSPFYQQTYILFDLEYCAVAGGKCYILSRWEIYKIRPMQPLYLTKTKAHSPERALMR